MIFSTKWIAGEGSDTSVASSPALLRRKVSVTLLVRGADCTQQAWLHPLDSPATDKRFMAHQAHLMRKREMTSSQNPGSSMTSQDSLSSLR
jgi:hypothetical protein